METNGGELPLEGNEFKLYSRLWNIGVLPIPTSTFCSERHGDGDEGRILIIKKKVGGLSCEDQCMNLVIPTPN